MIYLSPKISRKDLGLCKRNEKERERVHAHKHDQKKKKKEKGKKIAQVSKISKRRERRQSCKKEFIFHPPYPPYTHAHLDQVVWLVFFQGFGLWLSNIWGTGMLHFFHTYSSTYQPFRSRLWKKGNSMPWWGIIHIERSESIIRGTLIYFWKLVKPSDW